MNTVRSNTAVRFRSLGGPDVLTLDTVDVPQPGPGEVRIRTHAWGLNRADVMFRTGNHFATPSFPQAQGLEAAGTVDAIGADVTDLAAGDPVSVVPAFALTDYALHGQYVLAPARAVVKHSPRLNWVQAAALWMAYTTAYGALVDIAGIGAGDVIAINAASSSVGLAAIQIAAMVGARPIALSRTSDKHPALLEAGAHHVVATGTDDVTARLTELTDGAGVDVIFDPVAGPGLATLAAAAKQNAMVIVYGALSIEPTELSPLILLEKRLTVRGYDVVEVIADDTCLSRAVAFINDGVQAGQLTPTIDAVFTPDTIADAYTHLESGGHVGKVVVAVNPSDAR